MDNQNTVSGEIQPVAASVTSKKMEEHKKEILELLRNESESVPVILSGEMGTASWMAREIIKSDGLCYESLWVSVTKKYETELAIYKAIYGQLSSSSIPEEWEYADDNVEQEITAEGLKVNKVDWEQEQYEKSAKQKAEEETIENLKQKILAQLDQKRKPVSPQGKNYLLLVLDYEGSNIDDNGFKPDISKVLSINHQCLKIIFTRSKIGRSADATHEQTIKEFELGLLSPEELSSLLEDTVEQEVRDITAFKELSDAIKNKKSMRCPAAITVIAGSLNYIALAQNDNGQLESALRKAAYYEKLSQDVNPPTQGVDPLLYCAYDLMHNDVKKNCFWHSLQFNRNYGGVHYNELITHWIMEGYFDHIDEEKAYDIEKAYLEGHRVLMELIDRAMLKMQENNIVVMEGAALNMVDARPSGFGGSASLGLVCVSENGEGFGRVTRIDGMIKTLCNPKNVEDVSALLIEGARLDREKHEIFFSSRPALKNVAVFNSREKSLISFLSKLKNLEVLVFRNCDLSDKTSTELINKITTLRVLELSADSRADESSLITSLPENLFEGLIHLRSLNLSGQQMESLPSLANLSELRLLILRRCSRLKELRSLKGLGKLEIFDLSGAKSFKNIFDTGFSELTNIQMIDLSHTAIPKLPVFGKLKNLTRILLRGCVNNNLPILKDLTSLQILDLSGATVIRSFNFKDETIENLIHLKILDLSRTKMGKKLPRLPCNLSELNLSGCLELKELPSIEHLKKLEVLDLSDDANLATIKDKSFEPLAYLRRLLLKGCTSLQNLPSMEGVTRLEELDLSGCKDLQVDKSKIESLRTKMPYLKLNRDECGSNLLVEKQASS